MEQAKEIVEKAEMLDRLANEPGWEEICVFMGKLVNVELAKATDKPFEPEIQRVHVIRWDAMRFLLDSATGYMESIQRSRDEIVEQFRTAKENEDVKQPNPY